MSRVTGIGNRPSQYVGDSDWAYFSSLSKAALTDLVIKFARAHFKARGEPLTWEQSAKVSETTLIARGDRQPARCNAFWAPRERAP